MYSHFSCPCQQTWLYVCKSFYTVSISGSHVKIFLCYLLFVCGHNWESMNFYVCYLVFIIYMHQQSQGILHDKAYVSSGRPGWDLNL